MKMNIDSCGLWVKLLVVSQLLTAALLVSGAKNKEPDVVTVRELRVVDAAGKPRVILAAPMPDASYRGRVYKRRSPENGIQILDAEGNERGGLGIMDDGSLTFCFDSPKPAERACMYAMGRGDSGFLLGDDDGHERIKLEVAKGGATIRINDAQEKPIIVLPQKP